MVSSCTCGRRFGWNPRRSTRVTPVFVGSTARIYVIGRVYRHTVQRGETLLDIARKYDLAITVRQVVYSNFGDPWLLEEGSSMQIPALGFSPQRRGRVSLSTCGSCASTILSQSTGWSTLPRYGREKETPTPIGTFRVVEREVDPTWNIPIRLQHGNTGKSAPPGGDNPIGSTGWVLSRERYGIHGNGQPWSVGRIIRQRMHPASTPRIWRSCFRGATKETVVDIVGYQPVKFGFRRGGDLRGGSQRHLDWDGNLGAACSGCGEEDGSLRIPWTGRRFTWHYMRKVGFLFRWAPCREGGEGEQSSRHR